MSAQAALAVDGMRRTTRPGSLTLPFLRHTLVFVGVAAAAYLLRVYLPVEQQPMLWLAAGLLTGLLAGIVGGGWIGLLFVPLGAALGVMLELHLRLGAGAAALEDLQSAGTILLASAALMLVGYTVGSVGLRLVRPRTA